MYCIKCGQQTENENHICDNCMAAEAQNVTETKEQTAPEAVAEVKEETVSEAVTSEDTVAEIFTPKNQQNQNYYAQNNQYAQQNQNYYAQNTYAQPQNQSFYAQNPAYSQQPDFGANPRMYGFGKALASTILGFVGYFLTMYSFIFIVMALDMGGDDSVITSALFLVMSIAMGVVALILGIKSVKVFTYMKKCNAPKPIATLILGISGIIFAAITFFIAFMVLILFAAVLYA